MVLLRSHDELSDGVLKQSRNQFVFQENLVEALGREQLVLLVIEYEFLNLRPTLLLAFIDVVSSLVSFSQAVVVERLDEATAIRLEVRFAAA